MSTRSRVSNVVEKDVLLASKRRCCLCVYLHSSREVKRGQIAHLNKNPQQFIFQNLVYLCLEHHDLFDSQTSQSKGFTTAEVLAYRDQLYAENGFTLKDAEVASKEDRRPIAPPKHLDEFQTARSTLPDYFARLSRPWDFPLWQVEDQPELFAFTTRGGADGVCLIESVDLPDGRIVVSCIEIAGNPGRSITNAVEDICFQVCERFGIPSSKLVWLEHYDYYTDQEWNLVEFSQSPPNGPFSDPSWRTMTPELWDSLNLEPRKRLSHQFGTYGSKLKKRFRRPAS